MSSSSSSSSAPTQTLHEFLHTVPAPIVAVLVGIGPYATHIRRALEVVSWKPTTDTHPNAAWTDGWLAVAAWWSLCLFATSALRYALPVVVSAALAYRIWRPPQASEPTQPVTEKTLHAAIADLTTINSLLPPTSTSRAPITSRSESDSVAFPSPLSWKQLLRLAASLTLPYLILTYFVRLRILLGIAGTTILTYRALWAASLRRAFWASAHVRWGLYRLWSLLTGQPLPPAITPDSVRAASAASLTAVSEPAAATPEPLRFIFTVHENQRWWMGLDWTGALLPGERPSWCAPAPSLAPLPPPAAFTLPPSSSAVVGGRHRVARWEWAEPEWRVSVRREAGVGSSRIERAPPAPEEPAPATGGGLASSGSRLFAKMRESVDIKHAPPLSPTSATFGPGTQPSSPAPTAAKDEQPRGEQPPPLDVEEEPLTDADGWVYGDNKWEGQSPKGGMGKYTRFRCWTRIAVLVETIRDLEPGEEAEIQSQLEQAKSAPLRRTPPPISTAPILSSPGKSILSLGPASPTRSRDDKDATSLLRSRLKAVVKGSTT